MKCDYCAHYRPRTFFCRKMMFRVRHEVKYCKKFEPYKGPLDKFMGD